MKSVEQFCEYMAVIYGVPIAPQAKETVIKHISNYVHEIQAEARKEEKQQNIEAIRSVFEKYKYEATGFDKDHFALYVDAIRTKKIGDGE
jgi:hypothetical protein